MRQKKKQNHGEARGALQQAGRANTHKLIEMGMTIAIIIFTVVAIFANILKAVIE